MDKQDKLIEDLTTFKQQLHELPLKFGLTTPRDNFDYQRGKLRFDSWLKRYTDWLLMNVPGSTEEVTTLKYRYHDDHCMPVGSGYGTKSQMVNTVFIKPFLNKIDSIIEDIEAGHFKAVHKDDPQFSEAEYVSKSRIRELGQLDDKFDYSKLLSLLNELNIAYKNNMYYSVGCLVRAIIDHVPPVFGCNSFKEVANNYQGSKSFKDAMKSLDEQMRKVSDSYLHTQIRNKEIEPVEQQIEARSTLDFLLSEIIRKS